MGVPLTVTLPDRRIRCDTGTWPASAASSVVLPAPDGPMMASSLQRESVSVLRYSSEAQLAHAAEGVMQVEV